MSENSLHTKETLRTNLDDTVPLVAQRSDSSVHDCTCLIPRGKRKNSSTSKPSQNKRKRRGEVEKSDEEQQQVLTAAVDNEEKKWKSSESSCSVSSEDVSSEGQSKNSEPEETQSDHWDSEDNEPDSNNKFRGDLEKKYVQLDCLGAGGFGSVYAGYRRNDRLPVAIKHIPADSVKYTTVTVDGEEKKFPLEVVLLEMAGGGEAVALLDWFKLEEELVLVMERPVPSMDLTKHIQNNGGHLQEQEAKVILRQLVEGIINILSKGVLHRDIKPENILVHRGTEGLHMRILDFGCGCALREGPYTNCYGTTEYTLPEWYQQNSCQYVPSIVWQIGTVLYVMLNGKRPFRTTREMISKDAHMREELSQDSVDLLKSCLDLWPRSRPTLQSILQHPWLQ